MTATAERIVFMFPGQGSQYHQMGRDLYRGNPAFRHWLDHCDRIAEPLLGGSLIGAMFGIEDKGRPFDAIRFSNPCLLSLEYSLARTLMEAGLRPDCLLGYSLGEIAAAAVADALSLEDALRLAIGIAEAAEARTPPAKMLAVVDMGGKVDRTLPLPPRCWLTASNFPGNVVVGGLPEGIDALRVRLQGEGKIAQELPVRQGFHTELIDPIEAEVKGLARSLRMRRPRWPVISCLKAGPVEAMDEHYVWDIIRGGIHFPEAVRFLVSGGDCRFIDVGPSGSLANFVKYLLPPEAPSSAWPSLNQFGRDMDAIGKLLARFTIREHKQPV